MLTLICLIFSLQMVSQRHINAGVILLNVLMSSWTHNNNRVSMAPINWHQSTNSTILEPYFTGTKHNTNQSDKMDFNLVPDFMRELYQQYRLRMKNFTMKIEGNYRNLGDIDLIKSQRLIDIQHYSNQHLFKLKFKSTNEFPQSQYSILSKTLRCHQNLFPKEFHTKPRHKASSQFVSILQVYNSKMKLLRELLITENSFDQYGWLIVDLKNLDLHDNEFLLKIKGIWKRVNNQFRKVRIGHYVRLPAQPYHANLMLILKTHKNKDVIQSDLEKHLVSLLKRKKRGATPVLTRRKREINIGNDSNSHLCQRHPLTVNFQDVGWNRWVIAPSSYEAYYCGGRCPYPLSDHYHPTNHAIIQLLVHGVKDSSIPRPCCVPHALDSHTLLYLNSDGDALLQEFRDMSVQSCSCK